MELNECGWLLQQLLLCFVWVLGLIHDLVPVFCREGMCSDCLAGPSWKVVNEKKEYGLSLCDRLVRLLGLLCSMVAMSLCFLPVYPRFVVVVVCVLSCLVV